MATLSHYLHNFRGSWNSVSKLLVPSRFMLEKLVEWGISPERMAHIPIFIDYSETNSANKTGDYILYFGRIDPHKGVDVLLEAIRPLDCKVVLIGDGPLSPWVKEQIAGGLKNVEHIPFVSSRELLRNYIAGAAFSLVPSTWYENQPAVVLEAYAMGKPVIGSRIGGIPELIDDGHTGLLATAGDAGDLREKIQFLLERPSLAEEWGANGKLKLQAGFSRAAHYDRLMSIYDSVLLRKQESPITAAACS
jgi:glycosyltransferase involved in cell wall biosynthesis